MRFCRELNRGGANVLLTELAGIWLLLIVGSSEFITGERTEFDFNTLTLSKLRLLGDAHIQNGTIALTKELAVPNSGAGRALFSEPVRLFDPETGKLSSFTTAFSFSITNLNPSSIGAGLAFILAADDRNVGDAGGYIGVVSAGSMSAKESVLRSILAVEFDTCMDLEFEDINGNHVGLDVGSVVSSDSADLELVGIDLKSGDVVNAWIDYDGHKAVLNVTVSYSTLRLPEPILSVRLDLSQFLHEFAYVGFSAATQGSTETHTIQWWSFTSFSHSAASSQPPPSSPSPSPADTVPVVVSASSPSIPSLNLTASPPSNSTFLPSSSPSCHGQLCKQGVAAVTGVATAGAFILALCTGIILWFRCRESRTFRHSEILTAPEILKTPREFSYRSLKTATKNFDSAQIIGHGAFGTVYKGVLPTGALIAMKRCTGGDSIQGRTEFLSELSIVASLRHRNLVQLHGWCHHNRHREILLVYEFMPNGSLDKALFLPAPSILLWRHRRRILSGVASSLSYLHYECEKQIIHRDVKASNIMLDESFNPKLGDFGLARQIEHDKSPDATVAAGTMGYLAPEYVISGRATDKSDVFSFGAVVLEVACGRRPIEKAKVVNLVDWVWSLNRDGKLIEAADVRLGGQFDEGEMRRVLLVGLICSHPDPVHRPSMRHVVQMLNGEETVPVVPRSRPSMCISSTLLLNLQDSFSDSNDDDELIGQRLSGSISSEGSNVGISEEV